MMDQSILNTIKHMIGVENYYESFDTDLIVNINSAFMYLSQIGYVPASFSVTGATETWASTGLPESILSAAKQYIYMRVRLTFDPPSTSFQIDAITKQLRELEWRINVQSENKVV